MAEPKTEVSQARTFIWMGLADVGLGLGLAAAGYFNLLGEGLELLIPVGGVMALTGVGIALWGRHKLSQAASRQGDLN